MAKRLRFDIFLAETKGDCRRASWETSEPCLTPESRKNPTMLFEVWPRQVDRLEPSDALKGCCIRREGLLLFYRMTHVANVK